MGCSYQQEWWGLSNTCTYFSVHYHLHQRASHSRDICKSLITFGYSLSAVCPCSKTRPTAYSQQVKVSHPSSLFSACEARVLCLLKTSIGPFQPKWFNGYQGATEPNFMCCSFHHSETIVVFPRASQCISLPNRVPGTRECKIP